MPRITRASIAPEAQRPSISGRAARSIAASIGLSALAALTAFFMLAPARASALVIRECECSTSADFGSIGSTLTLGFRIEGDADDAGLFGLGASIYGYNEGVIDFVSGEVVGSIFHRVAIPGVGAFEGLENSLVPGVGTVRTGPLSESSIGASGNRVQFFNGVGLTGRTFNALDPGLDGVVGGGDAQVRVTFQITGAGFTTLQVGTGYNGDGAVYAGGLLDTSTLLVFPISLIGPGCTLTPEPNTALLLGLGLGLLARHRAPGKRRG